MSRDVIRPSRQVRQDFLDFFQSKRHTIVPSSSLMPDSPNLLFTNAGMNQFVPIFLGQQQCPYTPGRAADTQKCIRAGGKHNDLEDVGLDTYHHTFFEMLGNWSFGDYFKKEAIEWAWELVTEVWKFPKDRLYATVYKPGPGDPSAFDQEAYDYWHRLFTAAGLDPQVHIVNGNKKDNFWMMGETGPCGPCSELHVDLTSAGDTRGALVNQGSPKCIEIWNLVFMQFNANPDGTFSPLPAQNVDTGMGFERVASILQCTRNFTDFSGVISNYETDIFRPIFDKLEQLSGKKYGSTLPKAGSTGDTEREKIDVAFRVVADHIRTLSFSIADGIQPGNTDRNYVLRRILRRAVRYGRSLGFHEPFFFKLVEVLAEKMGDVFPEIRAKKNHVQDVICMEEEAFNKTLDRGIELFSQEAERLGMDGTVGGTGYQPVAAGNLPVAPGAMYSKRNLPHFEKPWAIYAVDFRTSDNRQLSSLARDIVLDCILHWRGPRYRLVAACVMPDHVHFIIQPGVKAEDPEGKPVFWSLSELLHSIKSFSANEINKVEKTSGSVWQEERYDRYIRSDRDLEEKYHYICQNPWTAGLVEQTQPYRWLWTENIEAAQPYVQPSGLPYTKTVGQVARQNGLVARSTQISGDFAFKLYDTYGFPLDLTELMARERGLHVDVTGFNDLMEKQRKLSQEVHAKKKVVIELSQIETTAPTLFVGYDMLETPAKVIEVVQLKNKTAVVLDTSACYAEMGGQVGDTGEIYYHPFAIDARPLLHVANTQKSGDTWLHFIEGDKVLATGDTVVLRVNQPRRAAIQRHHTVTHLLHWALHEVVSQEAAQKGSYVGPEKLTFDFNSAPLTPAQVAEVELLVNERIVENAPVAWREVPYAEVKQNSRIQQFFGEKYGDTVRVLQIGGQPGRFDGYSMELCGGTHVRATGEIGLFRIVGEGAIAAGVRRIEAVAGLEACRRAAEEAQLIKTLAGKVNSPVGELEKKIEAMLEQQKALEKQLKSIQQKQAAQLAHGLVAKARPGAAHPEMRIIAENLDEVDADFTLAVLDTLKGEFKGVVVLASVNGGSVTLMASVSPEFTKQVQAGKIIQTIAPLIGGKGGGKPDFARGGGRDAGKMNEAIAKAISLV